MPAVEELPSTIKRSPKRAQNTWIKAHDNAVKEYGEGRRAHMTAFAALKRSFEKVGDHWEPKKGPSDKATMTRTAKATTTRTSGRTSGKATMTRTAKAATRTAKAATRTAKAAMTRTVKTAEGVNLNATREYLQKMAAKLDVRGRSKMTKQELVNAIRRANRRLTAKAR
ncbi:ChaB family protein [Nonomuraea sp. NPDC052116]|uniref:ChaB family protein n=1 Tax=Nonomuraea sp. NPDC052116 TaxID=3155665 RepID=UPI0034402D91